GGPDGRTEPGGRTRGPRTVSTGPDPDRVLEPASATRGREGARADRRDVVLDRAHAADHTSTGHGRTVVTGHGGRIPCGTPRRRIASEDVPDADDRRGDHRAGPGARDRRRRGRA